jgi:hypothetical protein
VETVSLLTLPAPRVLLDVLPSVSQVGLSRSLLNTKRDEMSRRTVIRLAVVVAALLVVLPAALAAWLWFAPSGSGEFRNSPDGRFTAHASNMSVGTLTGGRDHYIEVRIVGAGTGREV